ncbi:MAG: CoA ester lyase [Burkholderiales bacterium]
MRSLLFVPGHDERKLGKGLEAGADALILDLEDAVPESGKARAREVTAAFVHAHRTRLPLFVRINALSTPHARDDLAAIAGAQPFGVMLPKCESGRDVARLDAQLAILERERGVPQGRMRVLPIVTETAASMFELGSYAGEAGPRLWGMLWGGEDLATDVGASANRADGRYTPPFQLARSLCLFGAAAAQVVAVDAVYPDFRDLAGLRAEAHAAATTGFGAKAAIHPAQVPIINEAFTPTEAALRHARAVVEAFARQPDAGAVNLDGRMLDRPHLRAAQRLLARAGQ